MTTHPNWTTDKAPPPQGCGPGFITVWDYYYASAVTGLLAYSREGDGGQLSPSQAARKAADYADAMIAARRVPGFASQEGTR